MGSGVAGGRIGVAVTAYLERRYGKAKTSIGVGLVAVVASLVLAIIYLIFQPVVTDSDLGSIQVRVTRFNVGRSSLDIWSGDQLYTARALFWRPAIADEVLQAALSSAEVVTIWVYPGETTIFGLEAGSLTIPTRAGIAEYMSNRRWWLGIWVGFLVMGLLSIGYGVWLNRREALAKAAA